MKQALHRSSALQDGDNQVKFAQSFKPHNWTLNWAFLLLAFFATSIPAIASHFKGGQITYKFLGEGQYEMTIKGYWDKDAVGNINPFYEGAPRLNTGSVTVSKTLLPDGMTVEHIQRQRVTWSTPGLYQISWRSCCRANGSNFGSEESGLFAAVNYNPQASSSSPQFYDLPIFNFNVENPINYNMNMEDPEGHEQEYSLELPYGLNGDPYRLMRESGFRISNNGTVSWEKPLKGQWLVNVKLREKINGVFTGAFVLRDFILNITAGNNDAPDFASVPEQFVVKGQTISFTVSAQDAQKHNVTLNANSSLFEKGASFTQTVFGANASGTFTWATTTGDLGRYAVQFVATDSDIVPLSSQITVYIHVVEETAEETCNAQVTYTLNNAPCLDSSNGQVTLSASKGVAPYTYSMDGGKSYQANATFSNLAAGAYQAIVKDATGCTSGSTQIEITAQAPPTVHLVLPAKIVCLNSVPSTLTGGTPAAGIYSGKGVENGVFYPAVAGLGKHMITYTYSNENGCTNTATQEIEVAAAPVVSAGADQTVTLGTNASIACATLTASGSPSAYTYLWSNGATTQSIKVCPATTTVYTVTATDQYGCSSTDEVIIFVKDARCGNKKDKVVVCHKGQPICIASQAVQAHLDHGDVIGDCSDNGSMDAEAAEQDNGAKIAIFPNPMVDQSQLRVVTNVKGHVSIDILDLNGKVVLSLHKGIANANEELNFDIKRSIGPGNIYIGRVITEKGVQTFKLIIAD
jgi:hypothetical protein